VNPIDDAVRILHAGGVIALPTETVYGLAADAENEAAIARVFAIKRRPADHPLIVHLADQTELAQWTQMAPPIAHVLAERFWPGPLTMVLHRSPRVSDRVTGGQNTVAIRVPAHPLAHAILSEFGGGLVAPSANRFGAVSPTTAAHVRADLGAEVDAIIDGGSASIGLESTIVDVTSGDPVILRTGAITAEDIANLIGHAIGERDASSTVRAPGMLASHYAPRARVELVEKRERRDVAARYVADGARVAVLDLPDDPASVRVANSTRVCENSTRAAWTSSLRRSRPRARARTPCAIASHAPPLRAKHSVLRARRRTDSSVS
jgi:L-threonylcarbamoyladenylate synthase